MRMTATVHHVLHHDGIPFGGTIGTSRSPHAARALRRRRRRGAHVAAGRVGCSPTSGVSSDSWQREPLAVVGHWLCLRDSAFPDAIAGVFPSARRSPVVLIAEHHQGGRWLPGQPCARPDVRIQPLPQDRGCGAGVVGGARRARPCARRGLPLERDVQGTLPHSTAAARLACLLRREESLLPHRALCRRRGRPRTCTTCSRTACSRRSATRA